MSRIKTQIGEVAYNPALACYQALVTFHSDFGHFSVAASYDAPLTADFDSVSDGLLRDALAGITRSGSLRSRFIASQPAPTSPEAPRHAA